MKQTTNGIPGIPEDISPALGWLIIRICLLEYLPSAGDAADMEDELHMLLQKVIDTVVVNKLKAGDL